jgi:AbrB family looped-hinge helix DNA binding protein
MPKEPRPETVFFSVKGQVVIPRRIRREFEIENGTRALVYTEGDKIVLKPMTAKHVRAVRGLLKLEK